VNLSGIPESKNFDDETTSNFLQQLIYEHQAQQQADLNSTLQNQPPGGYMNWLRSALNGLSPQELQMMKTNGLNINDIYVLRNFLKYGPTNPDVSIYKR
jgi:hypothetical protein